MLRFPGAGRLNAIKLYQFSHIIVEREPFNLFALAPSFAKPVEKTKRRKCNGATITKSSNFTSLGLLLSRSNFRTQGNASIFFLIEKLNDRIFGLINIQLGPTIWNYGILKVE